MALAKIVGLAVTPRIPSPTMRARVPSRQVAAGEVVEPGTLAVLGVQTLQLGHRTPVGGRVG